MQQAGNVLFIVADQMRGDLLDASFRSLLPLPNIGRLCRRGVRFASHRSVTAPCGPARTSLLTGLRASRHGSTRNGKPVFRHPPNLATEARKGGHEPLLFGYTDYAPLPDEHHPADPDLGTYEGVAPGFREMAELRLESGLEWPAWLLAQGYLLPRPLPGRLPDIYRPVPGPGRPPRITDPALWRAEHSDTAWLTGRFLDIMEARRDRPWFAHLAWLRPHPPLVAPAPYNRLFPPEQIPPPRTDNPDHPLLAWHRTGRREAPWWGGGLPTPDMTAELRAVYLGLVAELDCHLGRILDWLENTGQMERTLVILTSDHGDMLGDHGMWGKDSIFDQVFHVPLVICDPRFPHPREVDALTLSTDIMPTILSWLGLRVPDGLDGCSLTGWLEGGTPPWRSQALMEIDLHTKADPDGVGMARLLHEKTWKYVSFAGGMPDMLFDLAADPGETRDLSCEAHCQREKARLAAALDDCLAGRGGGRVPAPQEAGPRPRTPAPSGK